MKNLINKTFDIIFYVVCIASLVGMLGYTRNSYRNSEIQYKRDSLEYELLKIEYNLITNNSI
jgi:hypothetical protein